MRSERENSQLLILDQNQANESKNYPPVNKQRGINHHVLYVNTTKDKEMFKGLIVHKKFVLAFAFLSNIEEGIFSAI